MAVELAGLCPLGSPAPLARAVPVLGGEGKPVLLALGRVLDRSAQAGARSLPADRRAGETEASAPALQTSIWGHSSSTSYVFLGVEAVALYSYLRSRGNDRAASQGTDPGNGEPEGATAGLLPGAMVVGAQGPAGAGGGDFLASLASDHRGVSDWRGAAPAGPAADGGTQVAPAGGSALRFVNHIADRISGVTSALRALQLTNFQVSDNTRLRIDARTGRHQHFRVILTSRF
jgi:hypothetical protein